MVSAHVLSSELSGKIVWLKCIHENNVRPLLKNFILEFFNTTHVASKSFTVMRLGIENEKPIQEEYFYRFCNENMGTSFVSNTDIDILRMGSFESKKIARLSKNMFQSQSISLLPKEVIFKI